MKACGLAETVTTDLVRAARALADARGLIARALPWYRTMTPGGGNYLDSAEQWASRATEELDDAIRCLDAERAKEGQ